MTDSARGQRELVFCHSCKHEWYRDEHGLQCPRCESEAVEIVSPGEFLLPPRPPFHEWPNIRNWGDITDYNQIDPNSDPRIAHDDAPEPVSPLLQPFHHNPHGEDALPHNPLHTHNPWEDEAPDPDDGDIDHVQYTGPGGMRVTRISVRSGPGRRVGRPADPFDDLFNNLLTNPFSSYPRSPLQEGPHRQGVFTSSFHTTHRLHPRDTENPQTHVHDFPTDDLTGILQSLVRNLHGSMDPHNPTAGGGPNALGGLTPLAILTQMLNPANAQAGDAVYTQEALDRVISQLMEQHSTSSAPGPASPTAIAALPKIQLKKDQLDSNGKAECSICMDTLEIGAEVTELPCKHWFHGECVGAWLREHDTCPQCRRGIMPKEGDGRSPRTPGQIPRNMQPPWGGGLFGGGLGRRDSGGGNTSPGPSGAGVGAESGPESGNRGLGGSFWASDPPGSWPGSSPHTPHTPRGGWTGDSGNGSRYNPFRVPESPTAGPSSSSRPQNSSRRTSGHSSQSQGHGQSGRDREGRNSEGRTGSGSGGGILGWMGRRMGGGSH
ncbi:hypothetical protein MMC30_007734 [Trapelia coarctata]|nr:hypothetical protein [Trapelia coarctata]